MSAFATWLAGQRIRRVVIIAGLFPLPLLGLIGAATVVMSACLRGPREAAIDCLCALALLIVLSFVSGMQPWVLGGSAAFMWSLWLGLGTLAGRSQSLTLTVQIAVLLALFGLLGFVLLLGDPVAYWQPILEELYAELAKEGFQLPAGTNMQQQAMLMSGGLLAMTLSGTLLALLIGMAWAYQVAGQSLGDSFRALRLGYVIGGLAAAAGVLGLANVQLYGALLIFGVAFTCQGAAVVAWWAQRLSWPRSWWVALALPPFVLPQLFIVELALLAAMGFVDNWFSLRRDRG